MPAQPAQASTPLSPLSGVSDIRRNRKPSNADDDDDDDEDNNNDDDNNGDDDDDDDAVSCSMEYNELEIRENERDDDFEAIKAQRKRKLKSALQKELRTKRAIPKLSEEIKGWKLSNPKLSPRQKKAVKELKELKRTNYSNCRCC